MRESGFEDDLGVPVDALVELVVGFGCVVQGHVMGHDKPGFGLAGDYDGEN